jgi:hypothetical protein
MSLAPLIAARTCAYHTAWLDLVGFSIGCIRSELPVIGGGGVDDELAMTLDTMLEHRGSGSSGTRCS